MASVQDLKRRVRSVKNTRKITRAMKLVAAAKLRRAQDAIVAARPYHSLTDFFHRAQVTRPVLER